MNNARYDFRPGMEASMFVKNLALMNNVSIRAIAKEIGSDSGNLVRKLNNSKDLKVNDFVKMLDSLGYRVEIIEK